MALLYSPETEYILKEARDMAESQDKPLGTIHLLLAFFVLPNSAELLLKERHIDEEMLLDNIGNPFDEPQDAVGDILARAGEISGYGVMRDISALHLLVAITRSHESVAFRALKSTGINLPALRNTALSYISGDMPKRYKELFEEYRQRRRRMHYQNQVNKEQEAAQTKTKPAPPAPAATPAAKAPAKPSGETEPGNGDDPGAPYELDAAQCPTLIEMARNLSAEAARGKFDPLIGRDDVIDEMLDVLGKRRSNNPCLLGDPGVGKTAIVEGLAQRLVKDKPHIPGFDDPVLLSLDVAGFLTGTQYRGAFAEKMKSLKEEVAAVREKVILFIDEIHTIAMPSVEGAGEISRELKDALARGEFPVIGATTTEEFRQSLGSDPALSRRFHLIDIPEPRVEEAHAILRQLATRYAEHHQVIYTDAALDAAVRLSVRYIPDRRLPDKSINLIDLAGSRARRASRQEVIYEDLARIVSTLSGVPEEQISLDPSERLGHMEQLLGRWIVGHDDALHRIAGIVRRHYAGFSAERPIGSFLFLGPTGVGKTETARALSRFLFGNPDAMVRVDMSEFGEAHTVARLIGSPPGYVGYDAGGQLTEAIKRKPFQVVLFDEIEKAHQDVWKILLQILEDGRLTDGQGSTVSFVNTVVIMTSNLGSHLFTAKKSRSIGFAETSSDTIRDDTLPQVEDFAKNSFPPELWNRIDERIVFRPLVREQISRIAEHMLNQGKERLLRSRRVTFRWDSTTIDFLLDNGGFDPSFGARPLRRTIQRYIEAPMAELIVQGSVRRGDMVDITVDPEGGRLSFTAFPAEDGASAEEL